MRKGPVVATAGLVASMIAFTLGAGGPGLLGRSRLDPLIRHRPGHSSLSTGTSASTRRAPALSSFDSETVWKAGADDWEPMVAAAPGSSYVYQFTTRYGGGKVCGTGMTHCIFLRASSDGGTTWGADFNMCSFACKGVQAQNDPELKVATDGTLYAAWMNDYDVVFSKSTNHGATWSTPIDFKTANSLSFTDKPMIEISPTGKDVYVAFNASNSYVAASHDYGATFAKAVKTNSDTLYWFAEGGQVAPNGTVYFAESAENQNATGPIQLAVLKSTNGGTSWTTNFPDTSQQQPACTTRNCPADFYGAQANLAIDSAGKILLEYAKNSTAGAAMTMYTRTSTDGVTWSAPVAISSGGAAIGADFPEVAAGPTAGDFRVFWQDDSAAGSFDTWYRRTTDGGTTFSAPIQLSNLGSGASYKNANGYTFPYGDYFAVSVDSSGKNFAIWGEGPSYNGPGGVWFTRGV